MRDETPRPNRAGRHADYRHVRAVVSAAVHDEIRRESIERDVPMEQLYPEILAAGIDAIRKRTKKARKTVSIS